MTVVSMNIPNTVSIIKISSRSTYLLLVRPTSKVVRSLWQLVKYNAVAEYAGESQNHGNHG